MTPNGGRDGRGSWSISRVLSRTVIHLGSSSPMPSSSLPGNSAGHAIVSLFGLAPSGVCLAITCYHGCGALLPHRFALTTHILRCRSAVYFLLHFPSAHTAQALPGTLPYGARTFLRVLLRRDSLTNSGAHTSSTAINDGDFLHLCRRGKPRLINCGTQ